MLSLPLFPFPLPIHNLPIVTVLDEALRVALLDDRHHFLSPGSTLQIGLDVPRVPRVLAVVAGSRCVIMYLSIGSPSWSSLSEQLVLAIFVACV